MKPFYYVQKMSSGLFEHFNDNYSFINHTLSHIDR